MAMETATTFRSRARNPATRDHTVASSWRGVAGVVIEALLGMDRDRAEPRYCSNVCSAYNRISSTCASDTLASFGGGHGQQHSRQWRRAAARARHAVEPRRLL